MRSIPDVEQQWYQAPGGDYRQDLYGQHYPGSDPETVNRHLFDDMGVDYADPEPVDPRQHRRLPAQQQDHALQSTTGSLTAGSSPSATDSVSAALSGSTRRTREAPSLEIERLADHPKLVQVGILRMQSREPYGKPMFEPIWEAAAALRAAGRGALSTAAMVATMAPTFAGHAHTYPGYAAFMPLNYFVHLATLIVEGVFGRLPDLKFVVFADGGYDILTPLMWRLDTFLAVHAGPDAVG